MSGRFYLAHGEPIHRGGTQARTVVAGVGGSPTVIGVGRPAQRKLAG
ncbi:hypothetical protein I553_3821 [Mycobacterium xenopi 4042]|uniref:Uncharacterized protein n=1 Tax=Mycobacterium xenopi 4042 TaxID=1299334 RepID=X8A232_MYCXE|nr:hypothetical protein I553_3821 [Mycobacterium xenopi 4042]